MLADWDPRLISPEQALHMAGDWPVYASFGFADLAQYGPEQASRWQINLRCSKCDQSCGLLATFSEYPAVSDIRPDTQTDIGDLLSGVLRHLVTAHDWSLSGAHNG